MFCDLFRYDLVDVTRQALQVLSIPYYTELINSYEAKNLPKIKQAADNLLSLLDNMELCLMTNEYFLLGRWLNSARRVSKSPAEKKLLEFNARNQITTWGPRENVEDYANKMWSGLIKDFYKPRWQIFVADVMQSLNQGKAFNYSAYDDAILKHEKNWYSAQNKYPELPQGDMLATVLRVYKKYRTKSL